MQISLFSFWSCALYKYAWQFLRVSSFGHHPFLSNVCKISNSESSASPKKDSGICSEAFVLFPSAVALLYRQLDARVCWFFRSGRTIPLPAHPTRPLSVQGSPFSRTTFVCHISVSSSSVSLPASASSSNAGANAQRSGQSSIERRRSDTLFPCQLKSVQSVPS